MGLLQSLGLQMLAARAAAEAAAPGDASARVPPSLSDAAPPAPTSSGKPKARVPAPSITELAKWPSKAHRAWKRLDHVRQSAVAVQMASRYGQAFAKNFVAAAKSGKTKLEGADFVTALASQTPEAMKAAGYKLAQHGSNGDLAQEWWVRPDGFEVFLLRVVKPGTELPVEPPRCSKESLEQIEMALKWAVDALAEAAKAHKKIEAEKTRMQKLNVTSKDFEQAYDAMTEQLKDHITNIESVIADATAAKDAQQNSGCDLSKLGTAIDDLGDELTAFEVEKSLHEMDIRKPIKVDVKDGPAGDDE